jgi:uncharacterized damage-inducible protein DinB
MAETESFSALLGVVTNRPERSEAMAMANEAAEFAMVFERMAGDIVDALKGLPDELLNRSLPLPETNSLFALTAHALGSGDTWILQLAGGRTVKRDRDAEFRASGTSADLTERARAWTAAVHDALDNLPAATLDEVRRPATSYRGTLPEGEMTVRECLLHAAEHIALHLGHMQITRQLLENGGF